MKLLLNILAATLLFKSASLGQFQVGFIGPKGSVVIVEDNNFYDNDKSIGVLSIGGNQNKFVLDGVSFETYIDYGFENSIYYFNLSSKNVGTGNGKVSIYASWMGLDTLGLTGQLDWRASSTFLSGTPKKNAADFIVGSFVYDQNIGTSGTEPSGSRDFFKLLNQYDTSDIAQINLTDKYFVFHNFIEVDLVEKSQYKMNTTLSSRVYFSR